MSPEKETQKHLKGDLFEKNKVTRSESLDQIFMNPLPFTVPPLQREQKPIRRSAISSFGVKPAAKAFPELGHFSHIDTIVPLFASSSPSPRQAGRHIHISGGWAAPLQVSYSNS